MIVRLAGAAAAAIIAIGFAVGAESRRRPAEAEIRPRLRDQRAVSHRVGAGPPPRSRSAPTANTTSRCSRPRRSARRPHINQGADARHGRHHLSPARRSPARTYKPHRHQQRARTCSATSTISRNTRRATLFTELAEELRQDHGQPDHRDHLLRRAAHHREQGVQLAGRHEGHEDPRAGGAAVPDVHRNRSAPTPRPSPSPRCISRCRTARSTGRRIRCRRSRPRSSTKCRRHIILTGHIVEALVTGSARTLWKQAVGRRAEDVRRKCRRKPRPTRTSAQINKRKAELELPEEFKKKGKKVVTPDTAAFIKAAQPLHNDAAASAG